MRITNFLDNQTDEALKTIIRNHLRYSDSFMHKIKHEDALKPFKEGREHLRFSFDAQDCKEDLALHDEIIKRVTPLVGCFIGREVKVFSRKGTLRMLIINHEFKQIESYGIASLGTVDVILHFLKRKLEVAEDDFYKWYWELPSDWSHGQMEDYHKELISKGYKPYRTHHSSNF
tara:strand:- start:5 stop:526 length:522 start_codon:yes stop_codon:yes gene_type:complete